MATAKPQLPIHLFKTQAAFEKWMAKNHASPDGLWLQIYKKDAGMASVSRAEALDVALCYGWIDGQALKHNELSYLQKFTPRRARSIWSKINIGHIARLTKAGRMQPAGIAEVERAKADGRWENAYDSPSNMEIPADFLKALAKKPKAKKFFETLNKTNLFAIGWRLQTAKKPETRERRMQAILAMLEKGEKFH